jgi:hypothetical protein
MMKFKRYLQQEIEQICIDKDRISCIILIHKIAPANLQTSFQNFNNARPRHNMVRTTQ